MEEDTEFNISQKVKTKEKAPNQNYKNHFRITKHRQNLKKTILDSLKKNVISQLNNKLQKSNYINLDTSNLNKEMEIDNFNDSLNKSINKEKMNVDNEFVHKSKSSQETEVSNLENYSTSNSNSMNVENDKIKQKENDNKIENPNEVLKNNEKILNESEEKKEYITSNICLQCAQEYIKDILENLIDEEKTILFDINPNYFYRQNEINQSMRSILIDWIIDVVNNFNYKDETIYTTIYIIDSYLSKKIIERKNFQLLGITSLLIASKFNEIYIRKIEDYSFITNYSYSLDDIKHMEEEIAKTLNFNFLVPSCLSFYEIIAKKFGISDDINKYNFGQFLMQTFLMDFHSLYFSYSSIAVASLFIVMKFYKMKDYKLCFDKQFYSIKIKNENSSKNDSYIIRECAQVICSVINEIITSKLTSTVRKYSNFEFYGLIKNIIEP